MSLLKILRQNKNDLNLKLFSISLEVTCEYCVKDLIDLV